MFNLVPIASFTAGFFTFLTKYISRYYNHTIIGLDFKAKQKLKSNFQNLPFIFKCLLEKSFSTR